MGCLVKCFGLFGKSNIEEQVSFYHGVCPLAVTWSKIILGLLKGNLNF